MLHELFGEFFCIAGSSCLIRFQLSAPIPRDLWLASHTSTRTLWKPWCSSRSLRSRCKFCQVGSQPLWRTSSSRRSLCLHCTLCTSFTEHLLSHGDVADVPEGGLTPRANETFCMGGPPCTQFDFKSITGVLNQKLNDYMKGRNTFNLKENPHDWLGAEPADLQIEMSNETLSTTHLQLGRSPWCRTTWLCNLEVCK